MRNEGLNMSSAEVDAGICGFPTVVKVRKTDPSTVSVSLVSNCGKVASLGELLRSLNLSDIFRPAPSNPVYLAAGGARLHAGCPVPSAVIKAAEVELGLALCGEVHIRIIKEDADRALAQE